MPEVSVLILNWNGRSWLEQFLPSVMATTYAPVKIIVADNGSTDGSVGWLGAHYPEVEVVVLDKNYGFTGGNNRAVSTISSPYVVLLNSDVEVTPGWLEPLVNMAETDPSIAAIQPKVLAYHQKNHFEYAGAAGGFLDALAYPFCRGRMFDTLEEDEGQYEAPMEVAWATGACCLIRKSVLDEIGLFEEEFFAHMEEIDFCWRARNHGYRIMCEPASVVYHVGGGTLPQGNPRKTFLNVHNSLVMMYKNLPDDQLFPKIFQRLVLDGIWAVKAITSGDFTVIVAVFKAHWRFFLRTGYWRKRRKETYPSGVSGFPKGKGFFAESIVWAYFAKGKRRFSELDIS
ncbi:MAG: glycosyltransferase family 2 protein [Bacteroidota bacterium]